MTITDDSSAIATEPALPGNREERRSRRALLASPLRGAVAAAAAAGLLGACDLTAAPFDRKVHLLRRLTFGPTRAELDRLTAIGETAWLAEQLDPAGFADPDLDAKLAGLPALTMTAQELAAAARGDSAAEEVGLQLKVAALIRQVHSRAQLLERMVELWSDHFNVPQENRAQSLLKVVEDREVIRPHALGRFKDLLVASAQSPAMLYYLDNAYSSVGAINENYARELLELHTVGVDGGYTEDDVVATARLLTGWTIDTTTYEFRFVPGRHDASPLTIMGWTRPSGGDPLAHGVAFLHHLAGLGTTARFVCSKIAVRFVGDRPDAALVDAMADAWADNDSAIAPVLQAMVAHPSFVTSAGEKFSRPWDYLVHALRALGAEITPTTQRAKLIAIGQALLNLGQIPFGWPAPNGYPDVEPAWLNGGALLNRWNLVGDALAGQFTLVDVGDGGELLARLDGLDAVAVYDQVAQQLRFETMTSAGRLVLHRATGWSDDTVPSSAELRGALPVIALVLLTSADAQYR